MARVKIILDKNETMHEAEETLFKALNMQRTGDVHKGDFVDPAMTDVALRMKGAHEIMYKEMLEEIEAVLDEEYTDGNF